MNPKVLVNFKKRRKIFSMLNHFKKMTFSQTMHKAESFDLSFFLIFQNKVVVDIDVFMFIKYLHKFLRLLKLLLVQLHQSLGGVVLCGGGYRDGPLLDFLMIAATADTSRGRVCSTSTHTHIHIYMHTYMKL